MPAPSSAASDVFLESADKAGGDFALAAASHGAPPEAAVTCFTCPDHLLRLSVNDHEGAAGAVLLSGEPALVPAAALFFGAGAGHDVVGRIGFKDDGQRDFLFHEFGTDKGVEVVRHFVDIDGSAGLETVGLTNQQTGGKGQQ